jgi:hypothetical protein
MNIAVISFEDVCVDDGVMQLIEKYGKEVNVFIPVTGNENHFAESVMNICKDYDIKTTCFIANASEIDHILVDADDIVITDNPVKEMIRQINVDDVLGIVWDNSPMAHFILSAVEDFGIETWDITDGLDQIEIDYTDEPVEIIRQRMIESMNVFVEHMADYVMTSVLDVLSDEVAKRLLEDGKEIDPFKDKDL